MSRRGRSILRRARGGWRPVAIVALLGAMVATFVLGTHEFHWGDASTPHPGYRYESGYVFRLAPAGVVGLLVAEVGLLVLVLVRGARNR